MRSRSISLLLLMGLVSPLTACSSDSNTGSGNTETEKKPAAVEKKQEATKEEGSKSEETKKEESEKHKDKDMEKHDEGGEGGEG
jgi:hypothetical protein